MIEELLAKVAVLEAVPSAPSTPEVGAPALTDHPQQPSASETASASAAGFTDDQLKEILTELIGPIGLTVMEQVADRSIAEKPRAVLEVLRGVGLEESVLEQLRQRFDLG